jgi:putative peptide zinc metalloprotease protein
VSIDVWNKLAQFPALLNEATGDGALLRALRSADRGLMRPKLAPDVEVAHFAPRWGSPYTMVKNPRGPVYFRLTGEEGAALALLDGTKTVKEIAAERLDESGTLDADVVIGLIDLLHRNGFLEQRWMDGLGALRRRTVDHETRFGRWMRNLFKTQTIRFPRSGQLTDLGYRLGGRLLFTRPVVLLCVAALVAGPVAFALDIHSHGFQIRGYRLATGALILFALDLLAIFIHEAGHALAIRHAGRRVLSSGFQLYLGHPAFFIDSADILMAPPRDRIRNSWYGPFMSFVVSGVAALAVLAWPHMGLANVLFQLAFLNYFGGFLNLTPFLELDGYWILTDALGITDLLPRSLAFLRRDLWRKLRHRHRLTRQEWALTSFAMVASVFTVASLVTSYFLLGPLIVAFVRAMWGAGIPTRVLLVLLGLVVFGPLVHAGRRLAASLWEWAAFLAHKVRFRAQRRWRVEVGQLIDRLPVLSQLPIEDVNELAGHARLLRFARRSVVVRQGEAARDFFVVRKGTVVVLEEREDGSERELRRLGRGHAFGEVALLEGTARTATVRAETTCELFAIGRGVFEGILANSLRRDQVIRTFHQLGEIRSLPAFRQLPLHEVEGAADAGSWLRVAAGEAIVVEGETADAFYAIATGRFEVVEDGSRLRELAPGDHFGELALLGAVPRTATVRALTPGRLFRLDAEGFDRFLTRLFPEGTVHVAYERMEQRD